jgi:low affinity Fe/Cu permease
MERTHTPATVADLFRRFACGAAEVVGSNGAFVLALLAVVAWAATGPMFGFSDTWQLVINTGTTIVTFLMVFLIQYAQNRDNKALHLKLDELIRSIKEARNELIDVEDMSDAELERLQKEFLRKSREGGGDVADESLGRAVVAERRRRA